VTSLDIVTRDLECGRTRRTPHRVDRTDDLANVRSSLVTISAMPRVSYLGDPQVTQHITGSGSIIKR
jgi:hypothetical protein